MTPAFGFSFGDFINAIELIRKVSKALRDANGASSEYQHAVIELQSLSSVLTHLQSLEPSENNIHHVNAIRGMALACQFPLREFLAKIQRDEPSLGALAGKSFRGIIKKTKWAVITSEDVKKLRVLVSAKVVSINMLLATQNAESIARVEVRGQQHQSSLGEVKKTVYEVKERVSGLEATLNSSELKQEAFARETRSGIEVLESQNEDHGARLEAISNSLKPMQTSLLNLRSLGERMLQSITTLPSDIRDLLRKILRSNMQIYYLLLQNQNTLSPTPTMLLQSNIRFEDALGVVRELPYQWFRHWEPFEGLLRAEFESTPGRVHVLEGNYYIFDVRRPGAPIKKHDWSRNVFPGSEISMSMVISSIRQQLGSCPRPSCGKKLSIDAPRPMIETCPACGLTFNNMALSFDSPAAQGVTTEEDERIARQQFDEDLKVYGQRQVPFDIEEIIQEKGASAAAILELSLIPERDQGEKQMGAGRQLPYMGSGDHLGILASYPQADPVPQAEPCSPNAVIHKNRGQSRLDSWLDQSAVPNEKAAALFFKQHKKDIDEQRNKDREAEEIEIFRKIHILPITNDKERVFRPGFGSDPEIDGEIVEAGAAIYYRNILDRYPTAPLYLARRLAIGNMRRAKRLHELKVNVEKTHSEETESSRAIEDVDDSSDWEDSVMASERSSIDEKELFQRVDTRPNLTSRRSLLTTVLHEPQNTATLAAAASPYASTEPPLPISSLPTSTAAIPHGQASALTTPDPDIPRSKPITMTTSNAHPPAHSPRTTRRNMLAIELTESLRRRLLWEREQIRIPKSPVAPQCVSQSIVRGFLPGKVSSSYRSQSIPARPPAPSKPTLHHRTETTKKKPSIFTLGGSSGDDESSSEEMMSFLRKNCRKSRKQIPFGDESDLRATKMTKEDVHGDENAIESDEDDEELPESAIEDDDSSEWMDSVTGSGRSNTDNNQPFWSGIQPNRRSHSTLNRSLRGSATFHTRISSNRSNYSAREIFLPLPPVKLGDKKPFECDICGQIVRVVRRRDWKEHVFQDLQPYACTFPGCPDEDTTFPTRRDFVIHEMENHRSKLGVRYSCRYPMCHATFLDETTARNHLESHPALDKAMRNQSHDSGFERFMGMRKFLAGSTCPFCEEELEDGVAMLGRHLGRHMEEISFAVVTKPYEEWKFYNDSISTVSIKSRVFDESSPKCLFRFCSYSPADPEDLRRHVQTPHPHVCYRIDLRANRPCQAQFTSYRELCRHEGNEHNVQWESP